MLATNRCRAVEAGRCARENCPRESIVTGFEDLRHFLRMMEALGELLSLLPGCDVLEEQK